MFLHPWALAALAAVGLPLAIHWLTRPRPQPAPLSTLRFVRELVRQRRARHRLRDALVLGLRMLAIAAVAFAVARPRWGERPLVGDDDIDAAVRVVVLDTSQSMWALQHGAANFERARVIAAGHLKYRPGLRGDLILAGARPRSVFAAASQNFEALREALDKATVSGEALDVNRALEAAAKTLAPESESDHRRRELVIVSDFQRTNWARADFGPLPADTLIQLESVAPQEPPANLAILATRLRGRAAPNTPAQFEVEVGNYAPTAQRAAVDVTLGDAAVRLEGLCPPGRATVLTQDITLPTAGWHVGAARLAGSSDALSADDQRPIAIRVANAPRYALITRQRDTQRPSSSHFLECALSPEARRAEATSPQCLRVDPAALDRQQIVDSDLIVLDHPGTLNPENTVFLAGLLERGWPMLYVAAEASDARNLTALTQSAGAAKLPVQFAALASGQPRSAVSVAALRADAAPFRVLGENALPLARQLRFSGGLATRRQADALDDDVLATYSDGSACLVTSASKAASLAVLNADLTESTLPRSEAFVPLLDELVGELLQRGRSQPEGIVGEPLAARVPNSAAEAPLEVRGPTDSQTDLGVLDPEASGVVWRWAAPTAPGVYRVEQEGVTKLAMAVSLPPGESQLESLPADVLTSRLAAGRSVHYRAAASGEHRQDTLWSWILVSCVACLLGELGALLAFRS